VIDSNAAQSIRITPHTAVTRWRGESMDYDLAIEALCQQARCARDVSAEAINGTTRRVSSRVSRNTRGAHA
jgi:hypothetical protein